MMDFGPCSSEVYMGIGIFFFFQILLIGLSFLFLYLSIVRSRRRDVALSEAMSLHSYQSISLSGE